MSRRRVARCGVYECGRWATPFQPTAARHRRGRPLLLPGKQGGAGRDECARRLNALVIHILEERFATRVALPNPWRSKKIYRVSRARPLWDGCWRCCRAEATVNVTLAFGNLWTPVWWEWEV